MFSNAIIEKDGKGSDRGPYTIFCENKNGNLNKNRYARLDFFTGKATIELVYYSNTKTFSCKFEIENIKEFSELKNKVILFLHSGKRKVPEFTDWKE